MYESFYGLNERPFNLTPDPRFVFLSRKHKEAFAHLLYGIRERCGFIMVSGEIGTGKTTICRSLLGKLDSDTEVAFIFNPCLSVEELLRKVNEDFRIPTRAATVKGLVDELNIYLLEQTAKGKNCVLIIDEAQNLEPDVLEQIRLLSNLETETQKLLQIVLIGQPELAEKLETRELRQLNQRITARYHLQPLNFIETLHYIAFRLRTAGGRRKVRFTRSAVRKIYNLSKGTPRVINALCDRALLIGYTREKHDITRGLITRADSEVRGKAAASKKFEFRNLIPSAPQVITTGLLLILVVLLTSGSVTSIDEVSRMAGSAWQRVNAPPEPVPDRHSVNAISPDDPPSQAEPAPEDYPRLVLDESSGVKPIEVSRAVDPIQTVNAPVADFQETVRAISSDQLRNSGLVATLRAWNLAILEELPANDSIDSLRSFATENGLNFLEHRTGFDQLAAINIPVLISLDRGSGVIWVGLVGLEGDEALVDLDEGEPRRVSRAQLETAYTGRAIYMWAEPAPDKEMIGYFRRGSLVSELQDDLRALGIYSGKSSGIYDEQTARCIVQVQQAAGLSADAIVGAHTRMVLNSWLGNSPSLSSTAFSGSVRDGVLAQQARLPQFPTEPYTPGIQITPPVNPPTIESTDLLETPIGALYNTAVSPSPIDSPNLPENSSDSLDDTPVSPPLPDLPFSVGVETSTEGDGLPVVQGEAEPAEPMTEPNPIENDPLEDGAPVVQPEQETTALEASPVNAPTIQSSAYQSVLRSDALPLQKDVTPASPSQTPLRPRSTREAME